MAIARGERERIINGEICFDALKIGVVERYIWHIWLLSEGFTPCGELIE